MLFRSAIINTAGTPFNGSNVYVADISYGPYNYASSATNLLNITTDGGTIEMFFKISDNTTTGILFQIGNTYGTGNLLNCIVNYDLENKTNLPNKVCLAFMNLDTGINTNIWTSSTITVGTWYYIALSITNSSN